MILDRAERFILPQVKKTRWQVVHQDAHPDNVLVDPKDPTRVVGVIDFGDILFGPVVADLVAASNSFNDDDTDPLDTLCSTTAGYDSSFPLEENEIDLVYDMMLICLLIDTVIIGARDALSDGSEKVHIENTGIYPRMLKRLWEVGREKAIDRLRKACRFPVYSARNEGDKAFPDRTNGLLAKREASIGDVWYFYEKPLNFTRSQGPWLYTADGTAYLDAYNNVQQMGHANSHISTAIARQAVAINVNIRYICDIVADYAKRLTAELPDHLNACFFVNSGSEANDVAMQMARFATGNTGALVMEDAYHGMTETAMCLSPEKSLSHPTTLSACRCLICTVAPLPRTLMQRKNMTPFEKAGRETIADWRCTREGYDDRIGICHRSRKQSTGQQADGTADRADERGMCFSERGWAEKCVEDTP